MEKVPAIIAKMESLRDQFSKAELQVIDYIISYPDKVMTFSVADLADASKVSEATVVRASKKLGLSGYYELKLTLAKNLNTPLSQVKDVINSDDDVNTIMDKVFRNAINTLQYTHDIANKPMEIERAAEFLVNAKRVYIFGMGNSSSVAYDLQHKLNRIGITAIAVSDPHFQITVATYMDENDVVFAISHSGSSKDVIESVQVAKDNNAKIISMTNIGTSPLAKMADICLYTASDETKYRIWAQASRVAQIALIDTIYTLITLKKPDVNDGFQQLEALKVKKY